MALTEKVRLLLIAKGFGPLYASHEAVWRGLANDARELISPHIANQEPTIDDIKQVFLPVVELQQDFREFMRLHPKLTQKYWASHFTDYALHMVYNPHLNLQGDEQ
jgi:hypothetical protein